jgi:hypothetical protein
MDIIPLVAAREGRSPAVPEQQPQESADMPALLLGAGFALASLILVPALAQRIGLGSSLTIALRAALMRAAGRL